MRFSRGESRICVAVFFLCFCLGSPGSGGDVCTASQRGRERERGCLLAAAAASGMFWPPRYWTGRRSSLSTGQ